MFSDAGKRTSKKTGKRKTMKVMKKLIILLLTALLALGALYGCAGNAETAAPSATEAAQAEQTAVPEATEYVGEYEDTYKSTFSTNITSMNQYKTEARSDYKFIANLIDGLVETDVYGVVVPSLAESYEHNDDFSVWTFHLREGIYWVDSTGAKTEYQVTANDFVNGVRYIADPAHDASSFSTIRNVINGLSDYYYNLVDFDEGTDIGMTREEAEATFDDTVGVKALDDYTVEYTLSGSYPYFLSYAQLDLLLPLQYDFYMQVTDDYATDLDKMLYCGGYYISEWSRDKQITMTKNENYWDADNVAIKELSYEYVADNISSLELFERGDVTAVSLTSEEVASLKGTEWADYVYLSEKSVVTYWYSFNFATKNPELAAAVENENFRKAIFTAIDAVTLSAIWEPNNPEYFTRYTLLPEDAIFDDDGVDYTDYPALAAYKGVDPFSADDAKAYMEAAVAELCDADGNIIGCEAGSVDMLPITQFDVDGKLPIDIVYTSGDSDEELKKSALVKEMLETYLGTEYVNVILGYSSNSFSAEVYDLGNWDLVDDSYGCRYADPSANLDRCVTDYDITYSFYNIPEYDAMIEKATATYDIGERYTLYSEAEAWLLEHAYIKPYMTGGGSYNMTRVVPYTTPGGFFGMNSFKMKGAVIQATPVTGEQYDALTAQYKAEIEAQAGN